MRLARDLLPILCACSLAAACGEGREPIDRTPSFRVDSGTSGMTRADAGNTNTGAIVRVSSVIDGDTVHINASANLRTPDDKPLNGETVRFLGIDAPEIAHAPNPADCWGDEAHAVARDMMQGLDVELEFAGSTLRDDFGRLVAYVKLTRTGELMNERLVRDGHARSLTRFPHRLKDRFEQLEAQARQAKRGLWSCP